MDYIRIRTVIDWLRSEEDWVGWYGNYRVRVEKTHDDPKASPMVKLVVTNLAKQPWTSKVIAVSMMTLERDKSFSLINELQKAIDSVTEQN
jgi:hypothetical protein